MSAALSIPTIRHSREGGNPSPALTGLHEHPSAKLTAQVMDPRLRGGDEIR